MKITISGFPGAGKTTIGKLISENLNCKFHSTGSFRREEAKKLGMTIQEYNELAEKDDSTDLIADHFQKELGKTNENFVFEGRLSFHFIPNSIKILLTVDPKEGAKRILDENRSSEQKIKTINKQIKINTYRINADEKRYQKLYGLNCYEKSNFDIVIDTTNKTIDKVLEETLEKINRFIKK